MRKISVGAVAAAAVATALMLANSLPTLAQGVGAQSAPAAAAPSAPSTGAQSGPAGGSQSGSVVGAQPSRSAGASDNRRVAQSQYSGGNRGNWRRDYRRNYRYRDSGVGFGFAAGALLGSAFTAPRYYYPYAYVDDEAIGYCMQRFRSYDPVSMTYLGYDGLRHPCP